MDIVLGVSLTPKTVRMVLVEGEKGDGAIVDHDDFDVSATDGSATSAAADQVVAAVLGTQESAAEGGHVLRAIGVTWSDRVEAASLRDALAAHGIKDVMLVSELHAAGALAQAAGRAVGYESTALLFVDRDTATLSVVRSDDASIVKVLSRSLHSTDAMAVLHEMAAAVEAQDSPPQGMFVVGSGVDIASVKAHLADLVALPVSAPEQSGLALARGAALAAASAPAFDATTAGLAYALDPDGSTAGNAAVGLAAAETQIAAVSAPQPVAWSDAIDFDEPLLPVDEGRKPFLLVGSALTSIFVVGVVALAISLAVNIRPTVDQRPDPGQSVILPSAAPLAPSVEAQPPAPPPPAETIKAPVPVAVQEAPAVAPRTVYVAPPEAAPVPQAAPPAPAPEAPAPIPEAPPAPPPVWQPPVVPPVWQPPVWQPPVYEPPRRAPWRAPWQQWPQDSPGRGDDGWPQSPQQPQYPQYPQQPQYPQSQWPGQGSNGSNGGYPGGYGRGGDGGRGSSGPGACFLIFCSGGH